MAKRKRSITNAADFGTPEMARHFSIVPKLSDPTTLTGKVMDGDEIDRLLMQDVISPAEHGTLRSFEKKLHGFGFVSLKSPDYSSPIHADATAVADRKADTIRGAVHLFSKMDKHPDIGPHRRKKLVNMALMDAPWGKLRHQIEELHATVEALNDVFLRK